MWLGPYRLRRCERRLSSASCALSVEGREPGHLQLYQRMPYIYIYTYARVRKPLTSSRLAVLSKLSIVFFSFLFLEPGALSAYSSLSLLFVPFKNCVPIRCTTPRSGIAILAARSFSISQLRVRDAGGVQSRPRLIAFCATGFE